MPVLRRKVGRETLRVRGEEFVAAQLDWLLGVIASFDGRGKGLADGVMVQVCWSLLRLQRDGNELAVCEPDFSGDPFCEFRDDVTCTLAILLRQNLVLSRAGGVAGVASRFDEKVVLAKGCLTTPRVYAERQEPSEGDSGWYIGPVGGSGAPSLENLEARWAFQLLAERHRLLDMMSLPPGFVVVWDGDEIEAVLDTENRNVWSTPSDK